MKISEVLKKRAYSFSEIEDIEVIACDDFYGIALTCTTCNGIPTYDIYTLDKSYRLKLLNTFLGSKESAECAYNSLMESVRTKSEVKKMHWCMYENSCSHDCNKDCPYAANMCGCCISVSYKDCIGCVYNEKGDVKNACKNQEKTVK